KDAGYSNRPVNDMEPINVPPLAAAEGEQLARRLIDGEGLRTTNKDASAQAIASEASNFAFYIQSIVQRLAIEDRSAEPDEVRKLVVEQMTDGCDPWE